MESTLRSDVSLKDVLATYRRKFPRCSAGRMAVAMIDDEAVPEAFVRTAVYRALSRTIGDFLREDEPDGTPKRVHTGEQDEHGSVQVEFRFATRAEAHEDAVLRAGNAVAVLDALNRTRAIYAKRWRGFATVAELLKEAQARSQDVGEEVSD